MFANVSMTLLLLLLLRCCFVVDSVAVILHWLLTLKAFYVIMASAILLFRRLATSKRFFKPQIVEFLNYFWIILALSSFLWLYHHFGRTDFVIIYSIVYCVNGLQNVNDFIHTHAHAHIQTQS